LVPVRMKPFLSPRRHRRASLCRAARRGRGTGTRRPGARRSEVRSHRTSSRGCACLGCGADGFGEQRANGSFSTTVVTLTDLGVANVAGAIDEVHGRPVPVSVRVPSDEVVVQSDGILEPMLPHGTLDVLNGPLESEL